MAQESLVPANVTIWVNRANIEFRVYKNEAAIYEFGSDLAKPYFWPLETSSSKQITRSWPMRKDGPDASGPEALFRSSRPISGRPDSRAVGFRRDSVPGLPSVGPSRAPDLPGGKSGSRDRTLGREEDGASLGGIDR
jgi:hypothetical protein